MTKSILNDALSIKNEPIQKLFEYFHDINLTTFQPIFEQEKNEEEKKQTILFILCAYSEDSPMVILRQDSKEEKENICEWLNIPQMYHPALVSLADPVVRKCAVSYLQQFAGELFRNLMFMMIQYEYLDQIITNREFFTKEEGPIHYDWKEHGKATAEKEKLARSITKIQTELKQQSARLFAIESMKEWKEKGKNKTKSLTREMDIESSPQIR